MIKPFDASGRYRNLGNWTFKNVSHEARVDLASWGYGVCAGDYDSDGHLDLYVTNFGTNYLLSGCLVVDTGSSKISRSIAIIRSADWQEPQDREQFRPASLGVCAADLASGFSGQLYWDRVLRPRLESLLS